MPDRGHHLRRSERRRFHREPSEDAGPLETPQLRRSDRAEYPAAYQLPRPAAKPAPRSGGRRMTVPSTLSPPSYPPKEQDPVLQGPETYASVTDRIEGVIYQPAGGTWKLGFAIALL